MENRKARFARLSALALAVVLPFAFAPSARADGDHIHPCTNNTIKGTYGFYRTGPGPNGPVTAVGHITYDGHGNLTLIQDVVRDGEPSLDETGSGTYQVDPDCRAHGYNEDGVEISRSIVTQDGDTYYFISLTGSNVYGVATRIRRN